MDRSMSPTSSTPRPRSAKPYARVSEPAALQKFSTADKFVRPYRAYQWTQGFDVSADITPSFVRLSCRTTPCSFHVQATKVTFTTGPVAGKTGFQVDENPFVPQHSHAPPYVPLDLDAENARRATLSPEDPSLDYPPLQPVYVAPPPPAPAPSSSTTLEGFLTSAGLATPNIVRALFAPNVGLTRDTRTEDLLALPTDHIIQMLKVATGLTLLEEAALLSAVLRAKARRERGEQGINGALDPVDDAKARAFVTQWFSGGESTPARM